MGERGLSSLCPAESGTIVRVQGRHDVRRRLVEMGFVPGVTVAVVATAPLGDPLEVSLLGYRLAIRRSEAAGVTVRPTLGSEGRAADEGQAVSVGSAPDEGAGRAAPRPAPERPKDMTRPVRRSWRKRLRPPKLLRPRQHGRCHPQAVPPSLDGRPAGTIVVALAGNPNTGKSSLFNALTGGRQHVGNWPGKTVACVEGSRRVRGVDVRFIDLPGSYSLHAASPEEDAACEFLTSGAPDVVVAVIDSSNLERNLYLVLELAELGLPMVVAANMADMAQRQGRGLAGPVLAAELGMPVVSTVARSGRGVDELLAAVLAVAAVTAAAA